jgi:hypothetical protein
VVLAGKTAPVLKQLQKKSGITGLPTLPAEQKLWRLNKPFLHYGPDLGNTILPNGTKTNVASH